MLDKMRQAASEQAKRAAEAAQRATVAATDRAGEAAAKGIDTAVAAAKNPANQAKAVLAARQAANATAKGAGKAASGAGKAVKGALDKLNPATLAAIVMKATTIQEQANAVLRKNNSLYRIGGIEIGAAIPPSISFQIVRVGVELEPAVDELSGDEAGAVELDADEIVDAELEDLTRD
ncbi:MAG TPA: hypothetical protein VF484_08260 [Candidatus Limnocylindrales bacterium]